MMKKVLYGVALALLACVSFGTLQSCKDDVSDLRTQTYYDLEALKKSLLDLQKALQAQINNNKGEIENNRNNITKIWQALQAYATIDWVNNQLATLENRLNSKIGAINGEISSINGQIGALEGQIGTVNGAVNSLYGELRTAQGKINALDARDAELLHMILGALQRISDLEIKTDSHDTSIANLETLVSNLNNEVSSLRSILGNKVDIDDFNELKGRVLANDTAISTMQSVLDTVGPAIDRLKEELSKLSQGGGTLPDVGQQISDSLKNIKDTLNVLRSDLNTVNVTLGDHDVKINLLSTQVSDLTDGLGNLTVDVNTLRNRLNSVNTELEDVKRDVARYRQQIIELQRDVREIKSEIENIYNSIKDTNDALENTNTALGITNGKVSTLESKVQELERKLSEIKDLSGRIDSLITGILVQAADSPVFGNFSLPLGVKSTLLFNWYGHKDSRIQYFPSDENMFEADDHDPGINFEGMVKPVTIPNGFMADVDYGSLYLTVNPINHNFENTEFFLETSKGREGRLPFSLTLERTDDELTFGYSRATNVDNGFYKARVHITDDNNQGKLNNAINATRIEIDEDLKVAVKNALKDRTKRNAIDLLKAVYGQLSGKLPAYAVRYDWTVDNKPYSVLSNYDLAVATARPLSYNTFNNVGISKHFPIIDPFQNFISNLKDNPNLQFNFKSNIKFDDVELKLGTVTVGVPDANISIIIPPISVWKDGKEMGQSHEQPIPTDNISGFDELAKSIGEKIQEGLEPVIGSLNDQIKNNLLAQIQTQVDEMIVSMNKEINGKIEGLIEDFAGKADPWFKRLNRVVDLYNRVARKINNVLENPAHYVQVAMFYNTASGNVGMLSNSFSNPTEFAGGNGYINLYASSYTGEIVVPAFKKFVAVSNVYDPSGNPVPSKVKAANNAIEHFNEVMPGVTIRYAIPAQALDKNYKYEIVYQGLDYHGYTSTQKFYITVK